MKIPQSPPGPERTAARFVAVASAPDAVEVLSKLATLDDRRYLHWDDLRRRNPPKGLDHETWWTLLKVKRGSAQRVTPISATNAKPFTWNATDPILEQLHNIDLWAGGLIGLAEPQPGISGSATSIIANRETQGVYLMSSLINEAITSSQLEGASTTRDVAQDMLLSRRAPRDTSERMILNNYQTMQRIGELKSHELTPELVFELHRLVTADTLDKPDGAGRLRRSDEDIAVVDTDDQVLHQPPAAESLPERLDQMCAFANGKPLGHYMHPAVRAIVLHFWLAYDHPFIDGNGRTARALFYWAMLRAGYWLFGYVSISEVILRAPKKYGRAFLLTETDSNDLTYFVGYHLEVIRESLETLKRLIAKKADDVRSLDVILRGAADRFNHRQRELLSHALRHPAQLYTIAGHQARQGVVYQTARTDLLGLAEAGLLKKAESGNKLVFRPMPDLERKLAALDGSSP